MSVLTVDDCAKIAEDMGLGLAEADWLVGAMAPDRHASRAEAACHAAISWAEQTLGPDPAQSQLLAVAWAACVMDSNGVGGPAGAGGVGCASRRHPAFAGFPRKRQASGAAWTAAIDAAGRRLKSRLAECISEPEYRLALSVRPDGEAMVTAWDRDCVPVPCSWADAEWRRAYRRQQLLAAANAALADAAHYARYDDEAS